MSMKLKGILAGILSSALIVAPLNVNATSLDYYEIEETSQDIDRATGLISEYSLYFVGNTGTAYITARTVGNGIMSEIGLKNIEIQRSSDCINWNTEVTDNLTNTNSSIHDISNYGYSVTGGYYYRVVLNHYAKENTWWNPAIQSINHTSNIVWISHP